MCGIIGGVSSSQNVAPLLLDGLKKLEYRGYDSSGISLLSDFHFLLTKEVGKVENLENKILQNKFLEKKMFYGTIGVAHTRWATHGKVNIENTHPHNSKNFSIVHNGIVENYLELKKELISKGFKFKSETDSEVILYLLEYNHKKEDSIYLAIHKTLSEIKGSYALGIIYKKNDKILWAAKSESPLIIGKGKKSSFISSDKNAVSHLVDEIFYLNDDEIAKIEYNNVTFFTREGKMIHKNAVNLKETDNIMDKKGYDYFMEKEINEQPQVIRDSLNGRLNGKNIHLKELDKFNENIKKIENIEIISCGTSNHAALISKYWFENVLKIPCDVVIASEYRYKTLLTRKNTLFITISQSGETADTLSSLKLINKKNEHLMSLSVCNVEDSSISRESDATLLTKAGMEVGVASTKAFTTQLTVLLMLVHHIGREKGILSKKSNNDIINGLKELPNKLESFLSISKKIDSFVDIIKNQDNAIYIGRSEYGELAKEGALKLKEISYIHAEAFYAGELKHGSLALIDENIPVVVIAPYNELFNKIYSNVEEISAREGNVLMLTDKMIVNEKIKTIIFPSCSDIIKPICYTIPLQYIAFEVARLKGHDIDKPRNLAKSVTVE